MSEFSAMDIHRAGHSITKQDVLAVTTNLRVATISVTVYDYLLTIPWEYRLYTSSDGGRLGLILFVLIRYSSVVSMIVSNVGYFYHHFSPQSCGRYYHVIPVFKVIQVMVSQAILGIRAYNIALRHVWVGRTILSTYFIVVVIQCFSALANRIPVMTNGNCTIANTHPHLGTSTWPFYLVAILYDCLVLSISTVCLLRLRAAGSFAASQLVGILLYDGLGYFVALTAVNMMNLLLHRHAWRSIQTAGESLGDAVTWILSQCILIHLRKARGEQKSVGQPRTLPVVSTPMCFSEETMSKRTVNQAHEMIL